MPADCLRLVFARLDLRDLGRVARVCRQWQTISSDDEVWRKFQLYADPTPSPIKDHTVWKIQHEARPLLRRIAEIPEQLPDHSEVEYLPNDVSTETGWERKAKRDYEFVLKLKLWPEDVSYFFNMYSMVAKIFATCVLFRRIGYTTLDQAESLVLRTKETFHNPAPFKILAAEYTQLGNELKATAMKQIALQYS